MEKKKKRKKTVNSILYVGLLKWIQFRTYVHVPKDDDTFFSPPFFFPLQEREKEKKKKEWKRWQKFENNSIVCMFFIVMYKYKYLNTYVQYKIEYIYIYPN